MSTNKDLVTIELYFEDYHDEKSMISQTITINTPEIEDNMYFFIVDTIYDAFRSRYYNTSIIIDRKFITEKVFNKVNECLLNKFSLKLLKLIATHINDFGKGDYFKAHIIDFNTMKYHDTSDGKEPIHGNMIKVDGKKIEYDLREDNISFRLDLLKSRNPHLINYPYKSMFGNDIGRFSLIRNEPEIITEDSWMCEHCGIIYKLSDDEKHIGQILNCKNCRKDTIILDEDEYLIQGINPIESNIELWKIDNIFVVTGDESKDLDKALEKN